jgi:hypothetical protein
LIPSRYHWDQLDAKLIVLDINFPVRLLHDAAAATHHAEGLVDPKVLAKKFRF